MVEQTTGIIGTPAEIAAWNAPVLKGNKPRPRLRVPSGNIQIDKLSSLIRRASCDIVLCAFVRFSLSKKILPVTQYRMPKKGIQIKLFLPTLTVRGCTI